MSLVISLNPNNLSTYFERNISVNEDPYGMRDSKPISILKPKKVNPPKENKALVGLSKSAAKRMKKAINWITYLSVPRQRKLHNGVIIPKFSISFVTLTLPSNQLHSHKVIKSTCLNYFLTLIRKHCGVKNYVWKAELQANGNIHFHLTLDKFIHYMVIRKYWNKALQVLGYISSYQSKMQSMNYEDYKSFRLNDGTKNENVIKKAWNYGIKTNWTQPNTTDVHKVKDVDNLAAYMAKYLVKPLVNEDSTEACKKSAKTFEGRIWYCSQSLSRLKNAKVKVTEYSTLITKYLRALKGVFTFRNDFVTSYYFKINKLHTNVRMWLREQLISHAINCAYPFPANFQNII